MAKTLGVKQFSKNIDPNGVHMTADKIKAITEFTGYH
jgi:hypothetical protein